MRAPILFRVNGHDGAFDRFIEIAQGGVGGSQVYGGYLELVEEDASIGGDAVAAALSHTLREGQLVACSDYGWQLRTRGQCHLC